MPGERRKLLRAHLRCGQRAIDQRQIKDSLHPSRRAPTCSPPGRPCAIRASTLSDPDMDGTHSRLLLLKFFKRYLASLLEAGLVSVIIPPLYRINLPVSLRVEYAWSDTDRLEVLKNNHAENPEVMRLKGIAQFNAQECAAMFLKPESRQLFQVHLVDDKLQLTVEKTHARTL